jgi:hypothetical protein
VRAGRNEKRPGSRGTEGVGVGETPVHSAFEEQFLVREGFAN